MANGDITHIKELGRFTIPGGGRTTGGVAKNNKVAVWGEISASYVSTGINLSQEGGVVALGLTTLDFITLEVRTSNSVDHASQAQMVANLAQDEDKIYVLIDVDAGTLPTDGHTVVLQYFAIGDSAATVDLT